MPNWRSAKSSLSGPTDTSSFTGLTQNAKRSIGLTGCMRFGNPLNEEDRRDFCMDPRVIDWPTYVQTVHLPAMVKQARLKMQPGTKSSESRSTRLRKQVLSPERQLAVFDLENTLIASNVVASYAWLATRHLNVADRMSFTVKTLREAPTLLSLDRQDRSDFLRYFYRRFEGASVELMARDSREMLSDLLITKSFPAVFAGFVNIALWATRRC